MKFYLISISIILLCTSLDAKDKYYQCHWHQKGQSDFSSNAKFIYSEKSHFYYCISNDKDNIYLDLKAMDYGMQRQMLRSGITVWINTDGSKKKQVGLKYPVREERTLEQADARVPGKTDSESAGEKNEPDLNMVELFGFSGSEPEIIRSGSNGIMGSVTQHDLYVYYELVIPVSKLALTDRGSLVFGIAYSDIQSNGSMREGRRPGEGGGMPRGGRGGGGMNGGGMHGGGMHGGGMRGGGGMYDRGRMQERSGSSSKGEQKLLWIKNVKLASVPQE